VEARATPATEVATVMTREFHSQNRKLVSVKIAA
jgi:hypothetical protein